MQLDQRHDAGPIHPPGARLGTRILGSFGSAGGVRSVASPAKGGVCVHPGVVAVWKFAVAPVEDLQ